MKKDYTGIPHTCPSIDEVQRSITRVAEVLEEYAVDLRSAAEQLEKLRSQNEELRDFGNDQYLKAEELEIELKTVNNKIEILEDDISYYKDQIHE
jgi:chromosome segregation ATPase